MSIAVLVGFGSSLSVALAQLVAWFLSDVPDLSFSLRNWVLGSWVVTAGNLVVVFQPRPLRSMRHAPLVVATPLRVAGARTVLIGSVCVCAWLWFVWLRSDGGISPALQAQAVWGLVALELFCLSAYATLHWALGPEAFVPGWLIRAVNVGGVPIGAIVRWRRRGAIRKLRRTRRQELKSRRDGTSGIRE